MSSREILRREFAAEEASFLLQAPVRLNWDWDAFHRLTGAMYDVADEAEQAIDLVQYGFMGKLPNYGLPCKPDGELKRRTFNWTWQPIRPRTGAR
jgi:hypothetical protein